jgi:glycosyltransferase 2 family protein
MPGRLPSHIRFAVPCMARILPSFSPSLSKWLLLTARLAILVLLLGYAFGRADIHELQRGLMQSQWTLVLAGIMLAALGIPVAAWRWQLILAGLGAPLRFGMAARLTVIGLFLSQILPGMVGSDAARIWLTVRTGCKIKDAVNSVALDRLMMLISLLGLVVLALPVLARSLDMDRLQWIVPLLLAGAVLSTALLMLADRLPQTLQRWRVFRAIGYLATDARTIFLSWPLNAVLLAISLLSYLNMSGAMYLFAVALGQSTALWPFVLLVPPVLLAHTLPISMGGWGTREVAAVVLWGSIGIGPGTALLISVLFGVANLVVSLPGVFFLGSGRSFATKPP